MSGLQISGMTITATLPAGAFMPVVVLTNVGGLVTTTNYIYDAGLYFAKLSTLAAPTGAALIGTTGPSTVQADINARPTSASLSGSGGAALIGTNLGVTGSVTRTEASKLADIISVRDFGAVGDGTTDDTAAFQAAVDVTTSFGNTYTSIYIPPGLYRLTDKINLNKSHVRLFGAGDKSCLYFDPPSNNKIMILVQNSDTSQLINFIALEDFGFRSSAGSAAFTKTGIKLIDSSLVTIRNVNNVDEAWTSSGTSIGIHMCGRDTNTIEKCAIIADKPIYIDLNPNSVKYTFDYAHFSDLWLQTMGANNYAITFAPGAFPSNWVVDGDCVALKGKGGMFLDNQGTTVGAAGTPSMITIDSFRVESGTGGGGAAGGWGIYMDFGDSNNVCGNIWLKNCSVNDPTCNGYNFDGVAALIVENVNCGFASGNNAFILTKVGNAAITNLGIGDAAANVTFNSMFAQQVSKLTLSSPTSKSIAFGLYTYYDTDVPSRNLTYFNGVREWARTDTLSNAGEMQLPSLTAGQSMLVYVSADFGGALYNVSFTTATIVAGAAGYTVGGTGTASIVVSPSGTNKLVNVAAGASKIFNVTTMGN